MNTLDVAKTMHSQIIAGVGKWVFFSWGVSKMAAIEFKGLPTLALRVSGAVHKGWVYVSLEYNDTYTITLLNTRFAEKKQLKDVYCDELGQRIDELVERPAEWSNETYAKKATADTNAKFKRAI